MTSPFDPQAFLEATTTEAGSRRPPLPVENPATSDGLYIAILGEPKFRPWTGKKDPTMSGMAADIRLTIDVPPQLQDSMKLPPQVVLTDGLMLDLTAQGNIDWSPGKNRRATIYREACNLNTKGEPFSFKMFTSKVVKVKIAQELYNGDLLDKVSTVLRG